LLDVLIAGAGPTGTALAIDLVRRGLSIRIVDKAAHALSIAPGSSTSTPLSLAVAAPL